VTGTGRKIIGLRFVPRHESHGRPGPKRSVARVRVGNTTIEGMLDTARDVSINPKRAATNPRQCALQIRDNQVALLQFLVRYPLGLMTTSVLT